jgi:hypothetical protein
MGDGPAGVTLASYTAFLFNQWEGRDLWQRPLLFAHTLSHASSTRGKPAPSEGIWDGEVPAPEVPRPDETSESDSYGRMRG